MNLKESLRRERELFCKNTNAEKKFLKKFNDMIRFVDYIPDDIIYPYNSCEKSTDDPNVELPVFNWESDSGSVRVIFTGEKMFNWIGKNKNTSEEIYSFSNGLNFLTPNSELFHFLRDIQFGGYDHKKFKIFKNLLLEVNSELSTMKGYSDETIENDIFFEKFISLLNEKKEKEK